MHRQFLFRNDMAAERQRLQPSAKELYLWAYCVQWKNGVDI